MDVGIWLRGLGLERYQQAFADNEVDALSLPHLTTEDLRDMGVTAIGHRRRLLQAIADLPPETTAAEPAGPAAEAERRQLTVMFCDLVGSTALSAQLDPEDMREVIRAYQNTVAGEIGRFEGHLAKFMGDGVLAYFGWPRAHEDEAERAVRAALALASAVGKLASPGGGSLSARIGIATGLVVVGDLVGEGAAQEQAVVGDTPNLAARLQGLAEPGQVLIAEATRRLLGDLFDLIDLGEKHVKGIAEPVGAFVVVGERPTVSRFEAHSGPVLRPLVGRDQELALLLERWAQAKTGEGQGMLLLGEAGIGKSRISRALLDALEGEPHVRIRYQCSPYHTDSALWPVIQQLSHAAGLQVADSSDTKLDKLEALLDRTGEAAGAPPLIADLIGLDGTARYGKLGLTPQAQRARTLEALVQQLLALAAKQPVLVVLEDAHWIDPTTVELLGQWLDLIANVRVLLVLTSRPDRPPELAAHPHVTRLTLNRLGRAGVEAIVTRLGGDRLPTETMDAIIAQTDGVPLFVEELTQAVLETGETAIPATLHDSLMARLDRIPEVKAVAQIAACIGREFDHELLAAVVGRGEPDLQSALDKLATAELIFRRGRPPDATYTFKHALVQDAAHQSLLRSRRQVLHGRILEILEADPGETAPEVLAVHAAEGGRVEQAIGHWERAGRAAYERSAHKEAIAHYRAALDLVASIPDTFSRQPSEARLLIGLGSATGMLVGFGAAETEAIYRRALAASDHEAEPGMAAAALDGMWRVQHDRGDERAAEEIARQELAQAKRDGSGGALEAAYCNLGSCVEMLGDFAAARDTLRRVSRAPTQPREVRARLSGRDPRVYALSMEAVVLWQLGLPDTALSTVESAEAMGREAREPHTQVMPLSFAAKVRLLRRDYAEALQHAERTVQLAEEKGVAHFLNDALIWLGAALAGMGAAHQGLDSIRRGIAGRRSRGSFVAWPLFLLLHADALSCAGEPDLALDTLEQALEWTQRGGDRHWSAEIHRRRGTIAPAHARSGIDPEAELKHAIEIARSQGARSQELRATTSLAGLWAEQGNRAEALALLTPIYGWFTEGFDTADLKDAEALLDQLA